MESYLNIANDSEELTLEIEEKAEDLFEPKAEKAQLVLNRFSMINDQEKGIVYVASKDQNVGNLKQITRMKNSTEDLSQIFIIRQPHSWATLDISLSLLQDFAQIYNVFVAFWKCVLTFGQKSGELELGFPGHTSRSFSDKLERNGITESACVLRRVELHGRSLIDGQSPWSIRQTAVYHQYYWGAETLDGVTRPPRSMFLLINPSRNIEKKLSQCLDIGATYFHAVSPCSLQSILVADSLKGWIKYMAWLEGELSEQLTSETKSTRMVVTNLSSKEAGIHASANIAISVEDSQALKILDDCVTDLQVILPTLLDNVVEIRRQCQLCCKVGCVNEETNNGNDCNRVLEQFNEYIRELNLCVQRAGVLRNKAMSCAKSLSDLLNYQNSVTLGLISQETQLESKSMIQLTERGIKDAAAVKVLTIISLIYLPTAIVASFFSTQFVQTNANGVMHVSANAWILAAISLPLTITTVAIWWLWAHGKVSMLAQHILSFNGKQPIPDPEKGDVAIQTTHLHGKTFQGEPLIASRTASSLTAVSCEGILKI